MPKSLKNNWYVICGSEDDDGGDEDQDEDEGEGWINVNLKGDRYRFWILNMMVNS